jgi:hypothetical protein
VSSKGDDRKAGEDGGSEDLPHLDFATFVLSLSHSGLVHLGDVAEPGGQKGPPNLELAGHTIDVLALLEEKTRGNLTGQEERLLSGALNDLRLRLAEIRRGK